LAVFTSDGTHLFIDGKRVIKGWESFGGWYWFATEKAHSQDSLFADGSVVKGDQIYYGLVQGLEEEWGYFSEAELNRIRGQVWRIPNKNLPWSGRRS